MRLQNKYKIALVGYRLSGGGSDKIMTNLSLYLESLGVEIYVVTVLDEGKVKHGGTYVSTTQLKTSEGFLGRWNRAKGLKKFFSDKKFDYIIDFRFRTKWFQEVLISKFLYNAPTVFTVHSWATDHYIPKQSILAEYMYKSAYALVTVAQAIENKLKTNYSFSNVSTIYNPLIIEDFQKISIQPNDNNSKTILFVGQLENITKQLDHLLQAFSESNLAERGTIIKVCGTGQLENYYKQLVQEMGLEKHVIFLGYVQPPYFEMYQAKFLVLCSAYEGFGNVLTESLFCHTPVISYDMDCGPSEIIQHKVNGLLVENQSIDELKDAMILFFENDELYTYCKANARNSVSKFHMDVIGKQWVKLLKLM